MTQKDYDLICEIIAHGAPALSQRLIGLLSAMINDYQTVKKELETIKAETEEKKKSTKKSEDK